MASRDVSPIILIPATTNLSDSTGRSVVNKSYRGGHFLVNVTAKASTDSVVVFTLEGLVPATTNTWYDVAQWTVDSTNEAEVLRLVLYPGASTANTLAAEVVSDILPSVFRVTSTGTAGDIDASVSATLME